VSVAAVVELAVRGIGRLFVIVLVLEMVGTATPLDWSVGLAMFVVPPLAEPMFTLVVEEAAPPVPTFTVFVVAAAVAFVE